MEQNMNRLFQIGFFLILILLIAACSNGDAQSVTSDSTLLPNSETARSLSEKEFLDVDFAN
jgi:ABC-type Fe3+-citrate transport system substrate-binding protein